MKVIGINGSPRKGKNTEEMLHAALSGAAEKGAETKLIHLCDLNFTGCKSCFACKRLGGPSFGKCALRDDLTKVLEEILAADGLIVATPIYFGDITAATRAFYERILFPSLLYAADGSTAFDKHLSIGLIYTMGCPDAAVYQNIIDNNVANCSNLLGTVKGVVSAVDTLQFDDYSKYASSCFSEEAKREHRQNYFPQDLAAAKALGEKLF